MNIVSNLNTINEEIGENVTLVAVSKKKPITDIKTAYNSGHRIFGENRVQELVQKYNDLPKDIKWNH